MWLFDVMMFGKDPTFYGETDVLIGTYRGSGVSRRRRTQVQCLFITPVYSWMSGPVTTKMYLFDEHSVWTCTTDRWDKRLYS